MILNHDFRCDDDHQIFAKGSLDYPCLCRYPDPLGTVSRKVPWHWHPELEINYVTEGKFLVYTANHEYHLEKGDAVFVNSNAPHMTDWEDPNAPGKFISIIFNAELIGGMYGGFLERQYIWPVVNARSFEGFLIHPDSENHLSMLQDILAVYRLFEKEPFGFEIQVRNLLSGLWCLLMQETERDRTAENKREAAAEQIKPMLECIRESYSQKLSLEKIALSGSVSVRECNRIFKRHLHTTPVNYLNYYRIRAAAQKLLESTLSIDQIAMDCGIHSTSYMAKLFRSEFGCTPGEYRKKAFRFSQ